MTSAAKSNGTIMFFADGPDGCGRKVFDLKVTQSWPMVAFLGKVRCGTSLDNLEDVSSYQKLSLPPDLRLHLSGSSEMPRFLREGLVCLSTGMLTTPAAPVFSFLTCPPSHYRAITGKWGPSALVPMNADAEYRPRHTRLLVEAFAHGLTGTAYLPSWPKPVPGARPAGSNSGDWFGPHFFNGMMRKPGRVDPTYLFSFRTSFVDGVRLPDDVEVVLLPSLLPPPRRPGL